MSTNKRDFLKTVKQTLESKFPEQDGWEISEGKDWKGYKIDFVVERRNESKRMRKVIMAVPDCKITPKEVKHLNAAARRMSGRYVKITEKIYAIPADAETHAPEGFSFLNIADHSCQK